MRDRPADVGLAACGETATADPVQPATTTPDRSGRHRVRRAADRRASGRRRRRRVRHRSHADRRRHLRADFPDVRHAALRGWPREPVHRLQRALRSPFDGPPVGGEGMMPACRQRLAHRSRTAVSRRWRLPIAGGLIGRSVELECRVPPGLAMCCTSRLSRRVPIQAAARSSRAARPATSAGRSSRSPRSG